MSRNTAISMYGGAGGRDSRASVSSLRGLRSVLRNETERDHAPVRAFAPGTQAAAPALAAPATPAAPTAPGDDKQTLQGLNKRLEGYLNRVKTLQEENENLQQQIDEIMAKRKSPEVKDWDKIQKPLEDLKQKIKDITMDNARLMVEADNAKMANDDLKNKLEDEKKARKVLEKDLEDLKKIKEDTRLNQENTKKQIELVKDELEHIQKEHKDIVNNLCEKIRTSEVKVEMDCQSSNLSDIVNNIRIQYDKEAKKNLKDTENWYQRKFETIKYAEAQNIEALQSGKSELKDKNKEKQNLEMMIQSMLATIRNLEETLRCTKLEYGQRLAPLNNTLMDLETDLQNVRSQVENQAEINKELVGVKMMLEAEIKKYNELLLKVIPLDDSWEFSLADAAAKDQQQPKFKVVEEEKEAPANPQTDPRP